MQLCRERQKRKSTSKTVLQLCVDPDFNKTRQMCKKKRLEGKELSVSRVPVSKCILVEGLDDNITEDTVETYFESRRSRGGPVNNADMNPEEGRCYVYFEDSSGMWA